MEIIDVIPYDTKDRLRELLTAKNITQEKLAHDIGVSVITVSKWFNGGDIRISNKKLLAEYFDCDVEFLTCEQDTRRKNGRIQLSTRKITELEQAYHIRDLLAETKYSFDINLNYEFCEYQEETGAYVKDRKKYFYKDYFPVYSDKETYRINFSDNSSVEVTPEELKEFISHIQKYIAFQLNDLKDNKEKVKKK